MGSPEYELCSIYLSLVNTAVQNSHNAADKLTVFFLWTDVKGGVEIFHFPELTIIFEFQLWSMPETRDSRQERF